MDGRTTGRDKHDAAVADQGISVPGEATGSDAVPHAASAMSMTTSICTGWPQTCSRVF
jgi:hypothetical protein